eukprot:208566_1
MPFVKSDTYRERALKALDRQMKILTFNSQNEIGRSRHSLKGERQFVDYYNEIKNQKLVERAKTSAKKYLLFIRSLREGNGFYIPDQDRAVINEAIRTKLEPKYIELLLSDYPRSCEAGGIVDHVDHPIHLACSTYRQVVPLILKSCPDCAKQRDEYDRLPLEVFLERSNDIDISEKVYLDTVNLLSDLNPESLSESFLRRSSIKQEVIYCNLPKHLKCTLDDPSSQMNDAIAEDRKVAERIAQ